MPIGSNCVKHRGNLALRSEDMCWKCSDHLLCTSNGMPMSHPTHSCRNSELLHCEFLHWQQVLKNAAMKIPASRVRIRCLVNFIGSAELAEFSAYDLLAKLSFIFNENTSLSGFHIQLPRIFSSSSLSVNFILTDFSVFYSCWAIRQVKNQHAASKELYFKFAVSAARWLSCHYTFLCAWLLQGPISHLSVWIVRWRHN